MPRAGAGAGPFDMRCVILGAGALGSILAAHLLRAGHEVVVIARGARLAHLKEHPLRIHGLSDLTLRCDARAASAVPPTADLLINTVKTNDSRIALDSLGAFSPSLAFSVQNGVAKEEELTERYTAARVVGAMADFSGELRDDGSVMFTRNVCLHLGELDGGLSPRVEALARAVDATGIVCRGSNAIRSVIWSKYVGWNALMLVAVLTRRTTDEFLCDRDSALVVARIAREMAALAAARGIELEDRSPLPVATIATRSEAAALDAVLEAGRTFAGAAGGHRMSALQDVLRGTPLELEETVGHALVAARDLDVALPATELCYRLAASVNRSLRTTRGG